MKTRTYVSFMCATAAVGLMALLSSCADVKSDLPAASAGSLKIHPDAWLTKSSSDFHGNEVRRQGWSLSSCVTCHGAKLDGGTSGISCTKCHYASSTAENCTSCHGTAGINAAPPLDLSGASARTARGVGAHQVHLAGGTWSAKVQCNTCHVVPATVIASGHLDGVSGAEIQFDTLRFPGANQAYSSTNGTCANTYCHGNFPNGNTTNTVSWTDVTGAGAACGTCHGDKNLTDPEDRARPRTVSQGGTHPDKGAFGTTKCANCHGFVVDANLNFVDKSRHINGLIN